MTPLADPPAPRPTSRLLGWRRRPISDERLWTILHMDQRTLAHSGVSNWELLGVSVMHASIGCRQTNSVLCVYT